MCENESGIYESESGMGESVSGMHESVSGTCESVSGMRESESGTCESGSGRYESVSGMCVVYRAHPQMGFCQRGHSLKVERGCRPPMAHDNGRFAVAPSSTPGKEAGHLASTGRRLKVEVRALIAPLPGRGYIRILDPCVVRRTIDGRVGGGCQEKQGQSDGMMNALKCHLAVVVHCGYYAL